MRVVAIDGPSGSGKSTVARALAEALDLEALDTGAMYRAVTVALLDTGADVADPARAAEVAAEMDLTTGPQVVLDGRDVTREIRGPKVTAAVSTVAAHPEVRTLLVARQRAWAAERGGGVVEGRDIGTVVFPDAQLKIYLTASEDERAERRRRDDHDLKASGELADVKASMRRRDDIDSTRATSPLQAADDAVVIDTTGRDPDDVVAEVLAESRKVFG